MSEFETLEEYQKSMKDFKAKCISGFENFIVSSGDERAKLQLRCTPHTDKKGGYGCHDLDFGLSIWEKKQSEIDQLKAEKAGLEKRVESGLSLAEKWAAIEFEKTTHWSEGYEDGCLHCSLQLDKALRGEHE